MCFMKYTNNLKNKFKSHVKSSNTSIHQIAKKVGVTRQVMYNFVRDGNGVTYETGMIIKAYLKKYKVLNTP